MHGFEPCESQRANSVSASVSLRFKSRSVHLLPKNSTTSSAQSAPTGCPPVMWWPKRYMSMKAQLATTMNAAAVQKAMAIP